MEIKKTRRFETTDRAHADIFNKVVDQLNENDELIAKRAEEVEQNTATKMDFNAHLKDNTMHITVNERMKWNGSQIFNITNEDGQGKVFIGEADDFHVVLPQYTGLIHFTAAAGAQNGPDTAVRGIWTCDHTGSYGQAIAFDHANKTYRKAISGGNWSEWEELESVSGAQLKVDAHANNAVFHITGEERKKWSNAQLYKVTTDNGSRAKLANGTDILTLPTGFYFAAGHVVQNNPVPNDSSWFNYDVIETDAGRKTIYAWRSYDNTLWHGTVHTNGIFKGWKRIVTADDLEPSWTDVPLKNGASHGDRKVRCALMGGLLLLEGEIITKRGVVFGTLPPAYRPSKFRSRIVPIFGTTGMTKLYIETDGNMRLEGQIADNLDHITSYGLDEVIPR
ncbi:hypothetical protein P9D34_19100 [Bacillus swezeyi]|uniref:Uncharacterized protein n=1 Tax=Bacillus swezeyi TaxID=1925020 RepID=A0A1R1RQC0_9BACI|nr:hypothetical protein [Bacillus swezeyi]MEC1262491.1 hypothetical protein [Bacillus swezeyi]MED2926800.1 hypothetical protein [Bacillus swezeyi]MED2965638.1 hypothetical protein [Bacillus swezeyi]MED3070959.1 hypothetical protein [Bacillus swezeyi]MED3083332.1 hypothetical protein [Bacillus swezeyi]